MRTFVTGVAGFVGRHLVRALTVEGPLDLHGADHGALDAIPEPEELQAVLRSYRALDVTDGDAVAAAVKELRPDRIVHLAAQASGALSLEQPAATYRVNAMGALHLLEAVRAAGIEATVLLVGSADVYGSGSPGTKIAEQAPLDPRNPYALSKAAQDMLGELYASTYGLRVIRTRTFSHTGPGQSPRFAVAGFAHQLARIAEGHMPAEVRVGNVDLVREYGDARDVVRAYMALLDRGEPGEAYNVCTGHGYRLGELLERLIRVSGVRATVASDPARMRARDADHLVGDPEKLARRTGWSPAIPIDRTLLDLYRDARERVRREAGH
ncbi:MAG TPA: GDP-mannose 4,6-dehydratase [Candidatus Limnocylindrales bacterium]|nr:GDP-mannose 4,6-dehydratase [Candidatus Limnocylindrales bacterium]